MEAAALGGQQLSRGSSSSENVFPISEAASASVNELEFTAQQDALEAIPDYRVNVVRRKEYKEPEANEYGTFYQESVRYSDGAVRLATIAVPKEPKSPFPIVSGDPWLTGHEGFNNTEIKQLVRNGFSVVWNHHHGRHATLPTSKDRAKTMINFLSSKSIAKSASHNLALIEDIGEHAEFDTKNIMTKGYSRSAMTGEAVIALSAKEDSDVNVLWSDHEAACFLKGVGITGLAKILALQAGHEAKALVGIGTEIAKKLPSENPKDIVKLADVHGTLDLHPLNMAHEIAWIKLLIGGDTGKFAQAIPLDTKGVRTHYTKDFMSQNELWQPIYEVRPGIKVLTVEGAHLSGASLAARKAKELRYSRLADYIFEHEDDMSDVSWQDIVTEEEIAAAAA